MPDPDLGQMPLEPGRAPSADLRKALTESLSGATPAEAAIAAYFLNNLDSLPFETAASVAARIGVSEASVGRYCRSIGFRHFKALKASLQTDIGDRAWLIGDRLRAFAARKTGAVTTTTGLEREIAVLVSNHELAATPEFARAAVRLARCPRVFVAGFQTERGHARYLADMLHYLRPGVQMLDLADGAFAEPLLSLPGQACLVLFDSRRYSRLTRLLADAARQAGIPVTMVADPYCDWAHGRVDELFTVPVAVDQFWDSTAGFANLSCLLVNAVFHELGPEVEARMTRVSNLHDQFIGHARGPRKSAS